MTGATERLLATTLLVDSERHHAFIKDPQPPSYSLPAPPPPSSCQIRSRSAENCRPLRLPASLRFHFLLLHPCLRAPTCTRAHAPVIKVPLSSAGSKIIPGKVYCERQRARQQGVVVPCKTYLLSRWRIGDFVISHGDNS